MELQSVANLTQAVAQVVAKACEQKYTKPGIYAEQATQTLHLAQWQHVEHQQPERCRMQDRA